jgi:hypothetical protein
VTVINPESPWVLISARAAALFAGATLVITLYRLSRRAELRAVRGDVEPIKSPTRGQKRLYSVGLCIKNSGNRSRRWYRATFYFPDDECTIDHIVVAHGPRNRGGPYTIYGKTWSAVEYRAGPIFVDDYTWIGNVDVYAAPGTCRILWVIKSDDGRVPRDVTDYASFDVDFPS